MLRRSRKGKNPLKKATTKPAVEQKDEIVELTSRSEERVKRKVCTSFCEICRQGLFHNIMKMKWSYKRRYGAKFRKAIFGATVEFPAFINIKITGRTADYSTVVSGLNQYARVEFRPHPFHWNTIAVVYGYGHSPMQLHCHEHDEHRASGICVLTGEEGDCHGGALFVENGGIIHHEGKAIPTMGSVRMDPSLRGTCVTPNNMVLSLIHMHCMAHGNAVVGGWHPCFTRVHCRNTCGKRMLRNW